MFDSLKRALGAEDGDRLEALERDIQRARDGIEAREVQLREARESRQRALFPDGPVAGFAANGRYPGLHPFTFEEEEPQSWLLTAATGIIDNFPGGESLLSQLDGTFLAFAEANHLQIERDGPYGELVEWQEEVFRCWDLQVEVPVFVARQERCEVLGCRTPFVVLGRYLLDVLEPDERRFVLAASLAHVFFGNLRIFAFYRLFEMLDKLPSMTGLIARGLGMIPGVGNTISKGFELARSLNQQVIRKTNLVVGQRQHLLCDRLATLALGDQEAAQRTLAKLAVGGEGVEAPELRAQLIAQGKRVSERFARRDVDLAMLSIVGPQANFAAYRAYRLDAWYRSEPAERIRAGFYVTRDRLAGYRREFAALEEEIARLEGRVVELNERLDKLQSERTQLLAEREGEGAGGSPPD